VFLAPHRDALSRLVGNIAGAIERLDAHQEFHAGIVELEKVTGELVYAELLRSIEQERQKQEELR
jgi:hypothetical protein